MTALGRRFHDFWFPDAPPARLALLRIMVGLFSLVYLGGRYDLYRDIASTDPLLFEPVGFAAALSAPLPPWIYQVCIILTLLFNVLFLLGWFYRFSGPAFGLLLLWMLSYRQSWTMIYHSDNVMVFHALILGFTPAAEALSLDALFRSSAGKAGPAGTGATSAPESSWIYGWPVRLMCMVSVIVYFLCGVAKVVGPIGWSWALGEHLLPQFAVDGLRKEMLGPHKAPAALFYMYDYIWLFTILGVFTLVVELGAPLALFNGIVGRIWAILALLMHWGIYFMMDIEFDYALWGLQSVTFFNVERLVDPGQWRKLWSWLRRVFSFGRSATPGLGGASGLSKA